MTDDDDNLCPACDGSGGGGYPCECPSCGGSGRTPQRSGYDFVDADEPDYTDEPCNAEVCW
jgi:DnaJ-class molecular chaperone